MRTGIFLMLIILASCSTQHVIDKANSGSTNASAKVINRARKNHDYVSLQSGPNFYYVTFSEIDKTKKNMTVTLDKIDSIHHKQIKTSASNTSIDTYKSVAPHLHILLVDSTYYTYDEPHTIPLTKISVMQKL